MGPNAAKSSCRNKALINTAPFVYGGCKEWGGKGVQGKAENKRVATCVKILENEGFHTFCA